MGCVCAKLNPSIYKDTDSRDYDKSPPHDTLPTVGEPVGVSFKNRNTEVQKFRTDNVVDCPHSCNTEPDLKIAYFPSEFEAEHVAAGWPSWLVSVAGEVVKGWLPRKFSSFEKLNKVINYLLFQLWFLFSA